MTSNDDLAAAFAAGHRVGFNHGLHEMADKALRFADPKAADAIRAMVAMYDEYKDDPEQLAAQIARDNTVSFKDALAILQEHRP